MYATCGAIQKRSYSDVHQNDRMTFENRLWRTLRDDYKVLASNLRLKYETGRALIIFEDDEQFVMAKMLHDVK
jgi:hypothetical protein